MKRWKETKQTTEIAVCGHERSSYLHRSRHEALLANDNDNDNDNGNGWLEEQEDRPL